MDPGFASTCPRSTSSLSTPRSRQPTLSPPRPPSHSLRNTHTPPHTPRRHRSPALNRNRVAGNLVLLQQPPPLQLHQVQQLRVVHHVHLVHEHHQVRHVHLPRQQHMLPRLGHRAIIGRHHQNRPIHLRRPRDHVLDVVRVPRTIDVRVVPLRCLVLHVRHRNRDRS